MTTDTNAELVKLRELAEKAKHMASLPLDDVREYLKAVEPEHVLALLDTLQSRDEEIARLRELIAAMDELADSPYSTKRRLIAMRRVDTARQAIGRGGV